MIREGSFSAAKVFVREMQKFRNILNSQNFLVAKVSDPKVVHNCNVMVCLVVSKQAPGGEKMVSIIFALNIWLLFHWEIRYGWLSILALSYFCFLILSGIFFGNKWDLKNIIGVSIRWNVDFWRDCSSKANRIHVRLEYFAYNNSKSTITWMSSDSKILLIRTDSFSPYQSTFVGLKILLIILIPIIRNSC